MKNLIKRLVTEVLSEPELRKLSMPGEFEKKQKAEPKRGEPGYQHNAPKSPYDSHNHPSTRKSSNAALKAWFSDGWEGDMDEIEVGQTKEYDPIPGLMVGDYSWDHEGRWFEVTVMDHNEDGRPAYMDVKRTE